MPHRELGVALSQKAQAAQDGAALSEAAAILVGLWRADVLEAEFVPLAQQLAKLLDQDTEDDEPPA